MLSLLSLSVSLLLFPRTSFKRGNRSSTKTATKEAATAAATTAAALVFNIG